MKILVALKPVPDPDQADRIRLSPAGDRIDTQGFEKKINPFDHYALEAALRLTEDGANPKQRRGEVVAVTVGPKDAELRLRNALAIGAARGIRVDAEDDQLDGQLVAQALRQLVEEEKPDLLLLGKQAVDSETNQVGQLLAEWLDWPLAAYAATIHEETAGQLLVEREVDGGLQRVRLRLPAVITVDLRIVNPQSVISQHTGASYTYGEGVRFASLLASRQAQQKPVAVRSLAELVGTPVLTSRYLRFSLAPKRPKGRQVASIDELVNALAQEGQASP